MSFIPPNICQHMLFTQTYFRNLWILLIKHDTSKVKEQPQMQRGQRNWLTRMSHWVRTRWSFCFVSTALVCIFKSEFAQYFKIIIFLYIKGKNILFSAGSVSSMMTIIIFYIWICNTIGVNIHSYLYLHLSLHLSLSINLCTYFIYFGRSWV